MAPVTKPKVTKTSNMKPFNIQNFMGPMTTAQSAASGRLKVATSGSNKVKKAIIKGAIKKVKLKK